MFLVKIQESDNTKQKFQGQDHMIMKMLSLNMEAKNNRAMDLVQNNS